MDWLAFVAAVIGSLAWPVTVIVVVLVFRKQLLRIVPWLRELEVGNVKLKFAEELARAAVAAEEIPAPTQPALPGVAPAAQIVDRDLVLAEHAPIGLVLQSWMMVDQALADAANRYGLWAGASNLRPVPAYRLAQELEERRVITPATAQTIRYLRDLRNQVAHRRGVVDTDQALEYTRLAKKVVDALNEGFAAIPEVQVPG